MFLDSVLLNLEDSKIFKEGIKFCSYFSTTDLRFHPSGSATPGEPGEAYPSPSPSLSLSHFFCVAKRKKGNKGRTERVSKQKLLKGCYQGQNVTVLAILERLEFKNVSCRPTIVADNTFQCSMAPPLWNLICRPCPCTITSMDYSAPKCSCSVN